MPVALMVQMVVATLLLVLGVMLVAVGALLTGGLLSLAGGGWLGRCLYRI